MKNYNYFEGKFEYLYFDHDTGKKRFYQVSFKEGNFIEEYWTSKKTQQLEPWVKIYDHKIKTEYRITTTHKERKIIYNKPWEHTNTELVSVQKLGEEQVMGFDCEVVEVVYKHWMEGDVESFENKFTYWCCPDIQLREEWHNFSLSFLNHPGICQPYCLALKYTFFDEWNNSNDEYIIQKLEPQDIHPKTFSLDKYANFKRMTAEEEWQQFEEEHQQYEEEREREFVQYRQKLMNLVDRPLTKEENSDPRNTLFKMQTRKAMREYLQRELTPEEYEDPTTASIQLLNGLSTDENLKLGQLIIKYTSE